MASHAKMRRSSSSGKFVFDLRYVRIQAGEAIHSFFAPLSGVVSAARGTTDSRKGQAKS